MTERELRAFIDVVTRYFDDVTSIPAEMGVPFVKEQAAVLLDLTGLIGISGARRGGIYVTAPRAMLAALAAVILGTDAVEDEDILDMVGELANTIAGNMRATFGSTFMISVPIVVEGKPDDIHLRLKPPVFVIPIRWNGHNCYLSVGLE